MEKHCIQLVEALRHTASPARTRETSGSRAQATRDDSSVAKVFTCIHFLYHGGLAESAVDGDLAELVFAS